MTQPIPATIVSRRKYLLQIEGEGIRPCLTAANNWIGCTHCDLPCILAPKHYDARPAKPVKPSPENAAKRKQQNWWRVSPLAGHKHGKRAS